MASKRKAKPRPKKTDAEKLKRARADLRKVRRERDQLELELDTVIETIAEERAATSAEVERRVCAIRANFTIAAIIDSGGDSELIDMAIAVARKAGVPEK